MSVVKSDLIKQLADNYPNFLKKELTRLFEIVVNEIQDALKRGERIELRDVFAIEPRVQKARISRNPKTNEKVNTPEKKAILFKMSKNAIFIYFLNPLVIIELSGNLHHEGLMVFFMLLAFYHLKRKKLFFAAVFMGVSVLTKLIPLLLLPLFFSKLGSVKSLPFFGTIAGVIILGFSPFINLEFIVNYSQSLGLWFSNFEFNASLYYVLKIILKHFFELNLITYMRFIVPLIMGSTLLYFISRKQSKTRAIIMQSLWLLSVYFFISTTIHPWYLIPLVFLSCFGNYRFPLWWSFSVFLSYAAYFQNEVYENPYLLVIEYGILMAVLIYEFIVKVPKIKASSTG